MNEQYVPIPLEDNLPKPKFKEVIKYDELGEVVVSTRSVIKNKNGRGFVISYTAKMIEFIEKTKQGSIIRLFLYIAHNQQYGVNGVYGLRASMQHLSKSLGLNRKTVYESLEYLKSEFLVNVMMIDGSFEFMVNPDYITVGSDKKARMKEWSQRWEFYWKYLHGKKKLATLPEIPIPEPEDIGEEDTEA